MSVYLKSQYSDESAHFTCSVGIFVALATAESAAATLFPAQPRFPCSSDERTGTAVHTGAHTHTTAPLSPVLKSVRGAEFTEQSFVIVKMTA